MIGLLTEEQRKAIADNNFKPCWFSLFKNNKKILTCPLNFFIFTRLFDVMDAIKERTPAGDIYLLESHPSKLE